MPVEILGARDVPVASLAYLPGNPRRGNVSEIRKSVRRLGQYRAVVVRDTGDGLVILAGNHTVKALAAEGHETVRCEVIRCTDDEARRVALSDNRLSDIASDDPASLADLLAGLDGDYDGTGWAEEDVAGLLAGEAEKDPADAPQDDIPAVFGVIVECDTEAQQARLLEQLDGEGFRVRALMA